jgi:hypothetical protein
MPERRPGMPLRKPAPDFAKQGSGFETKHTTGSTKGYAVGAGVLCLGTRGDVVVGGYWEGACDRDNKLAGMLDTPPSRGGECEGSIFGARHPRAKVI